LTGGGSAGHVIPNLTLLSDLRTDGWEIHYVGTRTGIEAELLRSEDVIYHAIQTGKLRRYFDIKNFVDPFRFLIGIIQSLLLMFKIKPSVIFSKGGFVAAPVVIAGRIAGVPSVTHESDRTQGLANKICAPFASKICLTFEDTINDLSPKNKRKAIITGPPIRSGLRGGDAEEGRRICGFDESLPVLLAVGGSLGSESLNAIIRKTLPELLKTWQVAHICGKGNIDAKYAGVKGYAQLEYARDELAHLFKISEAAISRAGSNSIFELLYLEIPSILIPLPRSVSRGDQILNAAEFEKKGYSIKLEEHEAESGEALVNALKRLVRDRAKFVEAMRGANLRDSKALIIEAIYASAIGGSKPPPYTNNRTA